MNVAVNQRERLQEKDIVWYDKKARKVGYVESNEALMLQTQPSKPLSLKYTGP